MEGKQGGKGTPAVLRLSLRPPARDFSDKECARFVPRLGAAVERSIFLKEYVSKNSAPTAETLYIFGCIHARTGANKPEFFDLDHHVVTQITPGFMF